MTGSRHRAQLALAALVLLGASAAAQMAGVGDPVPEFAFHQIVLNGDGRVSPSEHLGQPVLYEFWGVR